VILLIWQRFLDELAAQNVSESRSGSRKTTNLAASMSIRSSLSRWSFIENLHDGMAGEDWIVIFYYAEPEF